MSTRTENIKVYLRIRPLKEIESGIAYDISDSGTRLKIGGTSNQKQSEFTFSKIFDDKVDQKHLFEDTMKPLVTDFVTGVNCLVFTYGVTNSGKTYTLQGIPSDPGILPLALDYVFKSIPRHHASVNPMPRYFNQFEDASPRAVEEHNNLKQKLLSSITKTMRNVLNEAMISGIADRDVSMFCPSVAPTGHLLESTARTSSELDDQQASIINDCSIFAEHVNPYPFNSTAYSDSYANAPICQGLSSEVAEETGDSSYSVWVSFLEIYNEQITDLLVPPAVKGELSKKDAVKQLKLHEDSNGNTYVGDLQEIKVNSAEEACQILSAGQKNLKYSATSLNQRSSRSHCIFNIKVASVTSSGVKSSTFSFCDLAGCERLSKANTAGASMKETAKINVSMLQLGQCLKQLRENSSTSKSSNFVAFRNSKLTHLFQNVLQGCGGRTVMIVNIAPSLNIMDETVNTLKLSAIAQKITTTANVATEMPKLTYKPPTTPFVKGGKLSRLNSSGMHVSKTGIKLMEKRRSQLLQKISEGEESSTFVSSLEEQETEMDIGGEEEITQEEDEDMDDNETHVVEEEDTNDGDADENDSSEEDDEDKLVAYLTYKKLALNYKKLWKLHKEKKEELYETTAEYDTIVTRMQKELLALKNENKKLRNDLQQFTNGKQNDVHECKQCKEKEKLLADYQQKMKAGRDCRESLLSFDRIRESLVENGHIDLTKTVDELKDKLFEVDEHCTKLSEEKDQLSMELDEKNQQINTLLQFFHVEKLSDIIKVAESSADDQTKLSEQLAESQKKVESLVSEELKLKEKLREQREKDELKESANRRIAAIRQSQMEKLTSENTQMMSSMEVLSTELFAMIGQVPPPPPQSSTEDSSKNKTSENKMQKILDNIAEAMKLFREKDVLEKITPKTGANCEMLEQISGDLDALLELQPHDALQGSKRKSVQNMIVDLKRQLFEKDVEAAKLKNDLDNSREQSLSEEDQVVILKANQVLRKSNILSNLRDQENRSRRSKLREVINQKEHLENEVERVRSELHNAKDKLEQIQKSVAQANNSTQTSFLDLDLSRNESTQTELLADFDENKENEKDTAATVDEDLSTSKIEKPRKGTVAAMKKNFEKPPPHPSSTSAGRTLRSRTSKLNKSYQKTNKRSSRQPKRDKRSGSVLKMVPEDSVLEEDETNYVDEQAEAVSSKKVNCGTVTTDSLDETRIENDNSSNISMVTRSGRKRAAQADSDDSCSINSTINSSNSDIAISKRVRVVRKPGKLSNQPTMFISKQQSNLFDMTQEGCDLLSEMEETTIATKKRATRNRRAKME